MSTLREQMQADLQLRGITPRTQKDYLREVRNLAKYFDKSPEELGEKKVKKEYLVHLLKDRKLSGGTYKYYVRTSLFRGKFLDYLKDSFKSGDLIFPGVIGHLKEPDAFEGFRRQFKHKKWVVYCKPPFTGVEGVLQYLSRYTHRIAISNHRILKIVDGKVFFLWRDYSDGDKNKVMTLDASEFIRRFLLHVLPDRFVKIRHYGLLANRRRKDNIALCRELPGSCTIVTKDKDTPVIWQELLLKISGVDVTKCPVCKKGNMIRVEVLYPSRCNGPPRVLR